jgi:hypothetical protein
MTNHITVRWRVFLKCIRTFPEVFLGNQQCQYGMDFSIFYFLHHHGLISSQPFLMMDTVSTLETLVNIFHGNMAYCLRWYSLHSFVMRTSNLINHSLLRKPMDRCDDYKISYRKFTSLQQKLRLIKVNKSLYPYNFNITKRLRRNTCQLLPRGQQSPALRVGFWTSSEVVKK